MAPADQPWQETEQLLMDLALYGLTVQEVQAFEAVLARVEYESTAREHGDGQLPAEELEKLAKDAVKTVQRASGSSLSRKLRGQVDADLLRELSELVSWRNYLAHCYLRNHWPLSSEDRQQLKRLALHFKRACQRLPETIEPQAPKRRGRRGAARAPSQGAAVVEAALRGSAPAEPWLEEGRQA
jgi:hypothetical protein